MGAQVCIPSEQAAMPTPAETTSAPQQRRSVRSRTRRSGRGRRNRRSRRSPPGPMRYVPTAHSAATVQALQRQLAGESQATGAEGVTVVNVEPPSRAPNVTVVRFRVGPDGLAGLAVSVAEMDDTHQDDLGSSMPMMNSRRPRFSSVRSNIHLANTPLADDTEAGAAPQADNEDAGGAQQVRTTVVRSSRGLHRTVRRARSSYMLTEAAAPAVQVISGENVFLFPGTADRIALDEQLAALPADPVVRYVGTQEIRSARQLQQILDSVCVEAKRRADLELQSRGSVGHADIRLSFGFVSAAELHKEPLRTDAGQRTTSRP